MARKPNYSFEKRQKELARQAKKEEKKQRKQVPGDNAETEPTDDQQG
jgi:dephospho-CoA kinase